MTDSVPISLALASVLGCLPLSAAVLDGSFIPLGNGETVNLTAEGTLDWEHWGLGQETDVNRKASVAPILGPVVSVGANPIQRLATNSLGFSWSDGAPTTAISNTPTGLSVQGLTNGFQITASADTERRRLRLFAGAEAAAGLIEASLSDASAPGYYDESLASAASISNGVFVVDFAAGSSGQLLTVRFTALSVFDEAAGRVLFHAAALASNLPPSVQLISPTNNASFFNSASVTLTANAADGDGAIQKVEFSQNGLILGEVFDPPYTLQWDSVPPGNYTLTARAFDNDGASSLSEPVSIVVLPNFAPTVAITNPADFASFTISSSIVIEASASDLDGSVTNVEFFVDATELGRVTNSPYVMVWTNGPAGEYQLTARATDNQGATAVSTAVTVFRTQSGGFLAGFPTVLSDPVDLDVEGPADWVHWGLYTELSTDRKRGVVPQISDYTIVGGGSETYPFSDNANTYSWSDGTPTTAVTNTATGVYVVGLKNGFRLQAPAGLTTNVLKVFVGAFAARGRMLAYLSDYTGPVYSDISVNNAGNGPSTVYTFQYAASSPGRTLQVRFLVDSMFASDGNVTLQAAALDTGNRPPFASVTNPPTGITLLWPTHISIAVTANDVDGSVTNLEFFRDDVKLGQKAVAPYSWIWSNATPGSHSISARATDNRGVTFVSRAADVFVSTGGGSLIAAFDFPSPQIDLAAEGTVDWTHWGLARANSFDHRGGATTRISDTDRIGNSQVRRYTDNHTGYSWTNGIPTPSAFASTTGIFIEGLSNGFQITAPADPSRRRLKVYAGLYGARGHFEAALSDNSARPFIDTSLFKVADNNYRVYTIDYTAATPGQQLVIRHTAGELYDSTYGNVTIQSATLADLPPPRLAGETWNGTAFSFRVPTLSAHSYVVQYSDVLPATNWLILEAFPGIGADVWITDFFPASPQRFYRVVEY